MTKLAAAPMMFATCLAASAHAATFTFPQFTIPGASSVTVSAINDSEQVAGFYVGATRTCCVGFTGKRGDITILPNYPASDGTPPDPREKSTKAIAEHRKAAGFEQNKIAARIGGDVAGDARRELEKKTGRPVVSQQNFLKQKLPGVS